ncbi:hypothetical protein ACGFJ5_23580 [Micromonospora echinaurantiaca]
MPERPVARHDSASEHEPPPELPREPRVSAPDVRDADDHKNHDPYQPL